MNIGIKAKRNYNYSERKVGVKRSQWLMLKVVMNPGATYSCLELDSTHEMKPKRKGNGSWKDINVNPTTCKMLNSFNCCHA